MTEINDGVGAAVIQKQQRLRDHRTNIRVAIIGMPNSGKTGIFNLLTGKNADVDDAVFTTYRPNFSVATFDDHRFDWLCDHFSPLSSSPSRIRVVDCPALIKGSAHGAGLGVEQITAPCGSCDALMIVVRAFSGTLCTQVGDGVNPLRDLDVILTELIDMDLLTLQFKIGQTKPLVDRKQGGSQMAAELRAMMAIQTHLTETKKPVRLGEWNDQEVDTIRKLKLLTAKEIVVAVNMDIRDYVRTAEIHDMPTSIMSRISHRMRIHHGMVDSVSIPYSGKFEEKIKALGSDQAVRNYLAANPTHQPSRHSLMLHIFKALQLIHFFTCGKEEVRAWCLPRGECAPLAARSIHRDFEEEFISVEVESFIDLNESGSEVLLKKQGKLTQQGRKYVLQDGDICFFKFKLPSYKAHST